MPEYRNTDCNIILFLEEIVRQFKLDPLNDEGYTALMTHFKNIMSAFDSDQYHINKAALEREQRGR